MRGQLWQDSRAFLVRVLGPACALWVLVVGAGFLLKTSTGFTQREDAFDRMLAAHRTATWNTISLMWSSVGNREIVAGVAALSIALVWWRTSDGRLAVIPAMAVLVQQAIFLLASDFVDRSRPAVVRLDQVPLTSSYPSGHVGATTALYVSLALLALRPKTGWLRTTFALLCALVPMAVMFARLYRGMHHPSDVVVSMLSGLVCIWLAYHWYLHISRGGERPTLRMPCLPPDRPM